MARKSLNMKMKCRRARRKISRFWLHWWTGIFLISPGLSAAPEDRFSVAIPADIVAASLFLGGVQFDYKNHPDTGLSGDTHAELKKRLSDFRNHTDQDAEKQIRFQDYQMDEARSGCYQDVNDTLAGLGMETSDYAKLIKDVLELPGDIQTQTASGHFVPAWWIGLDGLDAAVHPAADAFCSMGSGGYLEQRFDNTLQHWDALTPSQQERLQVIARRNNYQQVIYKALRHGANLRLATITANFRRLEQDLGLKAQETGSAADGLVILGVLQEGEDRLQYSVLTSQFPKGRWIPEGRNTGGIQPLSARPEAHRATALYLQTRWDLKIGPKVELYEHNLEKLETYLRLNCFGFVLEHVSGSRSLPAFLAEYQRAKIALQDVVSMTAALQEGSADDTTLNQLLENPYVGDAVKVEVLNLLTSAESFRQSILQRAVH